MPPLGKNDTTVRERLGQLIKSIQTLQDTSQDQENSFKGKTLAEFTELKTQAIILVYLVLPIELRVKFENDIKKLSADSTGVAMLLGILEAVRKDHKNGILGLLTIAESTVDADYMSLAEELLQEDALSPQQRHMIPAAVLAGAVLERFLRHLCEKQNPSIPIKKTDGKHKTLSALIGDLKKAEVFNKAKADELNAWAKLRNYAAHGEFKELKRSEIERMIEGIKDFMGDYRS